MHSFVLHQRSGMSCMSSRFLYVFYHPSVANTFLEPGRAWKQGGDMIDIAWNWLPQESRFLEFGYGRNEFCGRRVGKTGSSNLNLQGIWGVEKAQIKMFFASFLIVRHFLQCPSFSRFSFHGHLLFIVFITNYQFFIQFRLIEINCLWVWICFLLLLCCFAFLFAVLPILRLKKGFGASTSTTGGDWWVDGLLQFCNLGFAFKLGWHWKQTKTKFVYTRSCVCLRKSFCMQWDDMTVCFLAFGMMCRLENDMWCCHVNTRKAGRGTVVASSDVHYWMVHQICGISQHEICELIVGICVIMLEKETISLMLGNWNLAV